MGALYESYKVMESNEGQAVQTIPSYEVAKMMETKHSKVIRMIEGDEDRAGIIPTLRKAQMGVSDYFIESTYKVEGNNKTYKCYECTKLGCDLLANKMTGEKGILFTAKYVKRFADMKQQLEQPKQLSPMELLKLQYKALEEHEQKIDQVKHELDDYIDNAPLFQVDCKEVQAEVKRKGTKVLGGYRSPAYLDNSLRGKVYADIQRELKRQFGVNRYEAIKRKDYEKALIIISEYEAPFKLQGDIELKNSQIGLELEKAGVTNE